MYGQPYSENYNQYRSQVPYENQNTDFDCKGDVFGRDVSHAPGIVLDDYNSDLNFVIESDGVTGSSLHNDGFEYMWAGARATHGVKTGKVECYRQQYCFIFYPPPPKKKKNMAEILPNITCVYAFKQSNWKA